MCFFNLIVRTMKNSHIIAAFLVGVLGVLVGSFLAGVFLDRLTSNQLEVGDLATWCAAFGTLLTLTFLINQQYQNHTEQRIERQQREEHESKQQELFTFQKFQMHKSAFHSTLDQLEANLTIRFFDREALYTGVFPANHFENCSITAKDSEALTGIVSQYHDIWEHIATINQQPKDATDEQLFIDYFLKIQALTNSLKLTQRSTHHVGNVYWNSANQAFMGNVFDLKGSIDTLESVISRLCAFSNVEMPSTPTEPFAAELLIPFYKFMLSTNGQRLYGTDFEAHKPLLAILIQAYEELDKSGWNENCPKLVDAYMNLATSMFDAHRLIALFESQEQTNKLITKLHHGLTEYLENAAEPDEGFQQLELGFRQLAA